MIFTKNLLGLNQMGPLSNHGLKTLLQHQSEWLTFGWCVAHQLELTLKNSLSGSAFIDIDKLI